MKGLLTLFCTLALGLLVARAEVTPLSGASKVTLDQLPQAAQDTIKAQAGSAEIEDIDKGTLNGRTVYEAAFKRNGQNTELRVTEDGTIVDTIVAGASTGAAPAATAAITPPMPPAPGGTYYYGEGFAHELSAAHKVSWDQVPANIRNFIKQKAGGARIENIDMGTVGNKTFYQAAYKKGGKNTELRVGPNGEYQEVAEGVTISSSSPEFKAFARTLENPKSIGWNQVPANVQKVVQDRLGSDGKATAVAKGTVAGKTCYQFTYTKGGQPGQMRVTEDGSVKQVLAGKVIYEKSGAGK